jgi:hypothetical protein
MSGRWVRSALSTPPSVHDGRVNRYLVLATALLVSAVGACAPAATHARLAVEGPGTSTADTSSKTGCAPGGGFALSLVSNRGGQATPTAAATWFATRGGVPNIPVHGWRLVASDTAEATLRSGSVTLHALKGPDGTWQVDSGNRCP